MHTFFASAGTSSCDAHLRLRDLKTELRQAGGVQAVLSKQILGENSYYGNQRLPGIFSHRGQTLGHLVEWMVDNRWLLQFEVDEADENGIGGSEQLALDKIQQSLDGYPVYNWDDGEAMVAREIELRGPQE